MHSLLFVAWAGLAYLFLITKQKKVIFLATFKGPFSPKVKWISLGLKEVPLKLTPDFSQHGDSMCQRINRKINILKCVLNFISIVQIHLHIYALNKITLQSYFWYTKLVYLKPTKLEQLILCLIYFNRAEVQLKIYWSIFDCAEVELLQVYFRFTLNILHLKTLKHILGLILRNVQCAQVIFQIKLL